MSAVNSQALAKGQRKDMLTFLQSDSIKSQVALALPRHMKPDRMIRVMLTAINSTPKLLQCSRESLLAALMKCSQYGLEPDGRHAHLIPYGDHVQLIFDYKGLVDLVRRSGEVADIHCDVVYDADEFEYSFGSGGRLYHKPNLRDPQRGNVYCAYSFVKLKDEAVSYEVMTVGEINAVRDNSQGYQAFKRGIIKSNPWEGHWNEMAKKTVFRRHTKWLPLSSELKEKLNADDDAAQTEEARLKNAKQVFASEDGLPALPPSTDAAESKSVNQDDAEESAIGLGPTQREQAAAA